MDHCWGLEYIMIMTGRVVYAKQVFNPINVPSRVGGYAINIQFIWPLHAVIVISKQSKTRAI